MCITQITRRHHGLGNIVIYLARFHLLFSLNCSTIYMCTCIVSTRAPAIVSSVPSNAHTFTLASPGPIAIVRDPSRLLFSFIIFIKKLYLLPVYQHCCNQAPHLVSSAIWTQHPNDTSIIKPDHHHHNTIGNVIIDLVQNFYSWFSLNCCTVYVCTWITTINAPAIKSIAPPDTHTLTLALLAVITDWPSALK